MYLNRICIFEIENLTMFKFEEKKLLFVIDELW